jgi:hypothetical protein
MFAKDGIKGAFLNGIGEQVDTYLTFKLFDDPTLDVDVLLKDFFDKYYGAAGEPMLKLYLAIEEAYMNPVNLPDNIAKGLKESQETEEIAWGCMGTEERMRQFAKLMSEVKSTKVTDVEAKRLALFDKAVWLPMLKGREKWLANIRSEAERKILCGIPDTVNKTESTGVLPGSLSWAEASCVNGMRLPNGLSTESSYLIFLLHDNERLFIRLEQGEKGSDANRKSLTRIFFCAEGSGETSTEFLIDTNGTVRKNGTATGKVKTFTVARPDVNGIMNRILEISFPLRELESVPLKGGDSFMMNIICEDGDGVKGMLVPSLPVDNGKTPYAKFRLEKIDPHLLNSQASSTADAIRKDAVGIWKLDSAKEDGEIPDMSGHDRNGKTLKKAEWSEEDGVHLLKFRNEQCVNIDMHGGLRFDKGATLSIWVNSDVDPLFPGLFGATSFHLKLAKGGQIFLNLRDGNDKLKTVHYYNDPSLFVSPRAWRHIVGVWDGTVLSLYVNGRKVGTATVSSPPLATELRKLQIGTIGGDRFLQGRVAEAYIFSRALGSDEILSLFKDGKRRVMR